MRILPPELEVPGFVGGENCSPGNHDEVRMHGLPLRVFHNRCHLEPYLPMELFASAGGGGGSTAHGLLVGSSNRMFLLTANKSCRIDAVANAETGHIQINCESLKRAAVLSVHERVCVCVGVGVWV